MTINYGYQGTDRVCVPFVETLFYVVPIHAACIF